MEKLIKELTDILGFKIIEILPIFLSLIGYISIILGIILIYRELSAIKRGQTSDPKNLNFYIRSPLELGSFKRMIKRNKTPEWNTILEHNAGEIRFRHNLLAITDSFFVLLDNRQNIKPVPVNGDNIILKNIIKTTAQDFPVSMIIRDIFAILIVAGPFALLGIAIGTYTHSFIPALLFSIPLLFLIIIFLRGIFASCIRLIVVTSDGFSIDYYLPELDDDTELELRYALDYDDEDEDENIDVPPPTQQKKPTSPKSRKKWR